MKTTKNNFVNLMTNNLSYFIGVTSLRKVAYTMDELYCKISDIIDNKHDYINMRNCKANSTDLIFSDNSHLTVVSKGNTKRELHIYEYPICYVLECKEIYYDEWDECDKYKSMFYLIYK